MQSASDFKDYSRVAQLSAPTKDQLKSPRLRFGCVLHHPVTTQVIGIMQDLSERATKYFDVETLLYSAPRNILASEMLGALVQTMQDEMQKEEKQPTTANNVATEVEKQRNANKQAIDVPKMIELICFAFLISVAYSLIFNVYKFGVEPQMETIPTIVLCLLMIGTLIYRQFYWETVGRWTFGGWAFGGR